MIEAKGGAMPTEDEILRTLMKRICLIALIGAVVGLVIQLIIGGPVAFTFWAVAATLGFTSGWFYHKRKIRHERRRRRVCRRDERDTDGS